MDRLKRPTVQWTSNLKDKKDKEAFELTLRNLTNNPAIERLLQIMEEESSKLELVTLSSYDIPGWDNKQAHMNGMREAYKQIADLFAFIPRDKKGK